MFERAAELVGSRDYGEAEDKQELLKKMIEEEACFAGVPVSSFVAALEKGMTFNDARRFFYCCKNYDSKKEFLGHYFYNEYFSTSIEEALASNYTGMGIGVVDYWTQNYNAQKLIKQKLTPQIDHMLDHFNELIEKLLIKDRVACEDPETGKFYALSYVDSAEVLDENGNLDFRRL